MRIGVKRRCGRSLLSSKRLRVRDACSRYSCNTRTHSDSNYRRSRVKVVVRAGSTDRKPGRCGAVAVANLPAREAEMGDWTSGLPMQPEVSWSESDLYDRRRIPSLPKSAGMNARHPRTAISANLKFVFTLLPLPCGCHVTRGSRAPSAMNRDSVLTQTFVVTAGSRDGCRFGLRLWVRVPFAHSVQAIHGSARDRAGLEARGWSAARSAKGTALASDSAWR